MKKMITPLLIALLLTPELSLAKNSDLVKVEYVQTQTQEKGIPLLVAFVRVGFRVYRVLSRVNNINKLVQRIKVYVDRYGLSNQKLTQNFSNEKSHLYPVSMPQAAPTKLLKKLCLKPN